MNSLEAKISKFKYKIKKLGLSGYFSYLHDIKTTSGDITFVIRFNPDVDIFFTLDKSNYPCVSPLGNSRLLLTNNSSGILIDLLDEFKEADKKESLLLKMRIFLGFSEHYEKTDFSMPYYEEIKMGNDLKVLISALDGFGMKKSYVNLIKQYGRFI